MRTRFKDWISVVEAGYDITGTDQQWLEQLRNKSEPLLNRGIWPSMMTYRYSPTEVDIEHCATKGPRKLVRLGKPRARNNHKKRSISCIEAVLLWGL